MTEDFYDLLDVPRDASQDEIKEAFREQVRIYHPDLNDDDRAQAQFTALKKAYDILGDPVERRAYDRLGHKDYVAKRTSGIPSPDVWQRTSDGDDTTSSTDDSTGSETGQSTRTATAGGSTGTSSRTGGSSTSRTSRTRTGSTAGSTTSGATTANATGTASSTGATASSSSSTTNRRDAKTGSATSASSGQSARSSESSAAGNAFVQWWHDQNFAWPLIWTAATIYAIGLAHFGLENAVAIRSLGAELAAVGADPAELWAVLTSSRHGIDTTVGFVAAVEPVAPPLEPMQWYGALAGVVALAFLLVVGVRVGWRRDTWGPISIDETIVVALALGVSTVLIGGPLLAGAVLMPLLFGVIVYRTHQLPGWSPSYLYVLVVLAPGAALAAGVAGVTSLAGDVFAFGLLGLAGAFGLPLRATVRKRFGR
ncbi:J domain-containing protein [Natribaculum luteum]|uniref:J domain-containing protein n=1 Tax=Natribaculum luteum TaxID=1586232 RepID=A0ABD5NWZ9_9EURY|nr:DnaJ domain-containing protein [Natribaculum luteum]